jgi:hypothetical protein
MGHTFSKRKRKYSNPKKILPSSKNQQMIHELNELDRLLFEIDESIKEIVVLRELDCLEKQINAIHKQKNFSDLQAPASSIDSGTQVE